MKIVRPGPLNQYKFTAFRDRSPDLRESERKEIVELPPVRARARQAVSLFGGDGRARSNRALGTSHRADTPPLPPVGLGRVEGVVTACLATAQSDQAHPLVPDAPPLHPARRPRPDLSVRTRSSLPQPGPLHKKQLRFCDAHAPQLPELLLLRLVKKMGLSL